MDTKAATAANISARILFLVANTGLSPVDACRAVLGAGNVDAMLEQLYAQLREGSR